MRRFMGLIAAMAMLFALAWPVAAAEKLTICHATGAENNPFVAIKVAANSGFAPHLSDNEGNSPLAGHEQDFLLENTDLETCDQVDDPVTPLAPSVSDATCEAAGTLTLTEVDGVSYTIEPEYEVGDSGDFTVTATADEGFFIEEGAETEFEVTVPAKLNCASGVAPSVSPATCAAPGALTLNAVAGVTYNVNPAYSAGASGSFTVTAVAAEGTTLTGPTTFVVNVPAKLVCNSGTLGGNPPAGGSVPNTAMDAPISDQLPVALVALVALAGLGYIGRRNLMAIRGR
jgi:hypothetical protein